MEETSPARDCGSGGAESRTIPGWLAPAILGLVLLFLYSVRHILAPFITAATLAYVFGPVVGWIERRTRLRRVLAVALFFLVGLVPLAALIWVLQPAVLRETRELTTNTPAILQNLLMQAFGGESLELLGQRLTAQDVSDYLLSSLRRLVGTPAEAIHVLAATVETLLRTFLSIVLTFYFLVDYQLFARTALRIAPPQYREEWGRVARDIHLVFGRYIRGLLFLVVLMSTVTWVGLTFILKLPYALPLAIATGLLEIIPFLGPVVAGTIAAVVALFHGGPSLVLGTVLFYFAVRQLEDQLVMPQVVGKAVEIHPVLAIFAVLAGETLAGILGALLAIPAAAAIRVLFERWRPA